MKNLQYSGNIPDMNVLSVNNIAKSVKDENLFCNVSFGLDAGEHLGLIGKNGAGKSTFLKLIAGLSEPDEGEIAVNSSCRIGFLQQDVVFSEDCTLESFLRLLDDREIELLNRYDSGDSKVAEQVESLHLWDIETRYQRYLAELGVNESLDTKMKNLSGGEQKKAAIARILSVEPDILLLDEPTNHLDIGAIEWIESFLKTAIFTVILVTHDRYFLDNICTKIMEFDNRHAFFYEGGYTQFLEKRQERLESLQKEQDRLSNILRREIEWLRRGPQARTGKDSGRKQRIAEMQSMQTKAEQETREFSSMSRRLGKKILELKEITVKRNDVTIVDSFSFEFIKGMRIGVIGPNGSGKSTLLDAITGRLGIDGGELDLGINTVFGYYDQKSELLPLDKTPLEYFSDIAENIVLDKDYVVTPARFLELFGFPSSFHRLPIRVFSGGERRRLYLLSQLVINPNFLVLDEPTNDLDIDTIRRLEQYVLDFPGVVLTVSHDRAFLDRVCETLIVMPSQKRFEGTYSEYRETESQRSKLEHAEKAQDDALNTREKQRCKTHEKKGLSYKEQKELEQLEKDIEKLENSKSELESWFSSGGVDTTGSKSKDYADINQKLDFMYERWAFLSEKV